ncbi:hypothetical protein KP509_29G078300 [Ceratopteris richardii]|uniref:START domain-containing protein n=1 Tax=Ceratopteris richardii TaxID=49495 RepID=A0A8T2R9P4_CERRI|nr:hypothetical protein KP509_29G078300 [Ceratopteris richardii]KAH7292627.1 hypothetical protein KP509_29G078300 [Ceratopteris richardii]
MAMKDRELTLFSMENSSSLLDTMLDVTANMVPFWVAVLVGLFVGWIWKPRWVSLLFLGLRGRHRLFWTSPPGLGVRRFWFALTASVTAFQMLKECWLKFKAWKWPQTQTMQHSRDVTTEVADGSATNLAKNVVDMDDLRDLYKRFHNRDGGKPWELMMERSIPGMSYQAWRRDPQEGPTEYRSRTVFEDATPEIVKDFYWDDEFRPEWDDMIIYTKSLESCTDTGAEIAHWVRKFPFFCSNREYLIGRRIYESGGTFFCITKGVPYNQVPRQKKPRRVDVYSSSWCIRAVESPQTAQKTACEVIFLHSEDMGIQKDLAKLGVRQGMWNCVKKMEPGLRKYMAHRKGCITVSFSASMANSFTSVPLQLLESSDVIAWKHEEDNGGLGKSNHHGKGWKWIVVGGAVVLACGLDKGIVGKVVVFGLARRLSKFGRRL